jgi:hypothetical protein
MADVVRQLLLEDNELHFTRFNEVGMLMYRQAG